MTPHLQLHRHDPENGVWGDCFRTCVACLLDLHPAAVPHRHEDIGSDEQDRDMDAWLSQRGLRLIRFCIHWPESTLSELLAYCGYMGGGRFMVTGTSPRGTCHVVVADATGQVHDPHPDGGDLVGPCETGQWWLTFLGVLA